MHRIFLLPLLIEVSGCGASPQGNLAASQHQSTAEVTSNTSEQPGLEFFNEISGHLEIELSEPAEPIAPNLANEAAPSEARIVSLKLNVNFFEDGADEPRPLTEEELSRIAFVGRNIQLQGEGGGVVTHTAPNGKSFTARELLKAVEETERQSRGNSEWFDGVDIHHVFFEGIGEEEPGVWTIYWGS